jgi:hypothetical protein
MSATVRPTIHRALVLASDAQGVAADAYNAPAKTNPTILQKGATDAEASAAMLVKLASKYPHVGEAAACAAQGAAELRLAAVAWAQEMPTPIVYENVKAHADEAFKQLEHTLETLNNVD